MTTDEELVILVRSGRREAFDELARRYWTRCRNVAYVYTRNHADAEDQAQNSLVKAYAHIGQCDAGRFRSWLDKIVENQCRMFYRDEQRRPAPAPLFCGWMKKYLSSREPSPENRLDKTRTVDLVRREVLKLPQHWRGVLWLHRIEERPIGEVAAKLGIGVMAAKSRLFWAQQGLRARLKRLRITALTVNRSAE